MSVCQPHEKAGELVLSLFVVGGSQAIFTAGPCQDSMRRGFRTASPTLPPLLPCPGLAAGERLGCVGWSSDKLVKCHQNGGGGSFKNSQEDSEER